MFSYPGAELEEVHPEEPIGQVNSITWHHFHFQHGDFVRSIVKAMNGARNNVTRNTDG